MGDYGPVGWVADTIAFSCVDGPGNRFVLFLQGCSFDCLGCHNPWTIPRRSARARQATVAQLVSEIRDTAPFLSGVTASGGEATGQAAFVRALFGALGEDTATSTLTRFVDSNGDAPRRVWNELAPVTEGVMVDLKAFDPVVHGFLTGRDNAPVLASIEHLHRLHRLYEVRLLLVPGVNDRPDDLTRTAAWLGALDPALRVVLLAFRRHGVRTAAQSFPEAGPDDLERAEETLVGAGLTGVVRAATLVEATVAIDAG